MDTFRIYLQKTQILMAQSLSPLYSAVTRLQFRSVRETMNIIQYICLLVTFVTMSDVLIEMVWFSSGFLLSLKVSFHCLFYC
jgi:hypothetical protein